MLLVFVQLRIRTTNEIHRNFRYLKARDDLSCGVEKKPIWLFF